MNHGLPRPRISQYPQAPSVVRGPGPVISKPGSTPPEKAIFFGPVNGLNFSDFSEVYREVVRGYAHGKLAVQADVAVSAATAGTLVAPFIYVDVQIVGFTNGIPEVLAYGATGMTFLGSQSAYPSSIENKKLDAPPVQTTWDDSFSFDEIAILLRTMGNGGQPFGAGWANNPGDLINVSVAGKLWR